MTEGRQPFTAEIKTLAKGPSTYDPLENTIDVKRPFGSHRFRSHMVDKQPPGLGSASSTLAPNGGHSEPVAEAPESPRCQGFGARARFTQIECPTP
jgi:hypothetical protein